METKKIFIPLLLLCTLLFSCATKYITKDNIQKEYITCTDTLLLHDSIVHRDSITIFAMGDTVIKECIRYRDKYKYIYKVKTDTVIKIDSIMVQLPATTTKKSLSDKIIDFSGAIALLAFVVSLLVWLANKYIIK